MKEVSTQPTRLKHPITKLLCLGLLSLAIPLAVRAQVPFPSPYSTAMYTTNTLFIEAEDADYNHGQTVTTTNIGMNGPYPGGSYTNLGLVTDANFDWNVQSATAPRA